MQYPQPPPGAGHNNTIRDVVHTLNTDLRDQLRTIFTRFKELEQQYKSATDSDCLLTKDKKEYVEKILAREELPLLVCGPNDVGKSTLLNAILDRTDDDAIALAQDGRTTARFLKIYPTSEASKVEWRVNGSGDEPWQPYDTLELLEAQQRQEDFDEVFLNGSEAKRNSLDNWLSKVIEVKVPSFSLGGLCLIDPPGFGELDKDRKDSFRCRIETTLRDMYPIVVFLYKDVSFKSDTKDSLLEVSKIVELSGNSQTPRPLIVLNAYELSKKGNAIEQQAAKSYSGIEYLRAKKHYETMRTQLADDDTFPQKDIQFIIQSIPSFAIVDVQQRDKVPIFWNCFRSKLKDHVYKQYFSQLLSVSQILQLSIFHFLGFYATSETEDCIEKDFIELNSRFNEFEVKVNQNILEIASNLFISLHKWLENRETADKLASDIDLGALDGQKVDISDQRLVETFLSRFCDALVQQGEIDILISVAAKLAASSYYNSLQQMLTTSSDGSVTQYLSHPNSLMTRFLQDDFLLQRGSQPTRPDYWKYEFMHLFHWFIRSSAPAPRGIQTIDRSWKKTISSIFLFNFCSVGEESKYQFARETIGPVSHFLHLARNEVSLHLTMYKKLAQKLASAYDVQRLNGHFCKLLCQIQHFIDTFQFGKPQFEERIGAGAFGTIISGTWKGKNIAIKQPGDFQSSYIQEAAFLENTLLLYCNSLHLQHVMPIEGILLENDMPLLIMPLMQCSLEVYQKEVNLHPMQKLLIACQVAVGVRNIHRFGFIHRDIKPHNILIDDFGTAFVADLGIAEIAADEAVGVGTRRYMAPEMLEGDEIKFPFRVDVYSCGVLFLQLWEKIGSVGRVDPSMLHDAPQEIQVIIRKCLLKEPEVRIDSLSLCNELIFLLPPEEQQKLVDALIEQNR
jgi:serine/threonine protein kinase/GTPase SAR1 family protein